MGVEPDYEEIREFIVAQLVEDEQLAREASAFYDDHDAYENGVTWNGHEGEDLNGFMRYWIAPHLGVVNGMASGHHIGRHDPARVLADVAAARNLLEAAAEMRASDHWGLAHFADVIERNVAASYAARPGYKPSWQPR